MAIDLNAQQALKLLQDVSLAMVREARIEGAPDFTLRQLSILLTVYLEPQPHTVRGLARKLGVTKPVVTRALDSLGKLEVIERRRDETDRRNVVVQRTAAGVRYVERLRDIVVAKAKGQP